MLYGLFKANYCGRRYNYFVWRHYFKKKVTKINSLNDSLSTVVTQNGIVIGKECKILFRMQKV